MSYLDYLPDYEDSFETELNESEQSAFDLSALQESLMSITPTPKLGVPLFPNPLENFFKAEPTAEDTDIYEEMPVVKEPIDRQQQKTVDAVIHYNTLKRDRTNIYSSATRMMNLIQKVMANRPLADWEALLKQALLAQSNLSVITQELNKINVNTSAAENLKSIAYQERISGNIAKIQSHIHALQLGVKEGIEHTFQALEPELPRIGTADVAAQAKANALEKARLADQAQKIIDAKAKLDAQIAQAAAATQATAAASATFPFAAVASGGAPPTLPDKLDTLVNMLGALLTRAPPPGGDPFTGTGAPAPASGGAVLKDYRGLKPIEIPTFSGDTTEYHLFKKYFEAGHNYRNLDKTTMTLLLTSHLRGPALKLANSKLTNKVNDDSYKQVWDALELRYGGSYNEDMNIAEKLNKLPPMLTLEFKEVERTFNALQEQHEYYLRKDPDSLRREQSALNKQAKSKFTVELGNKYLKWCELKGLIENFNSILEWLQSEYKSGLKSQREFGHSTGEKGRKDKDRLNQVDSELQNGSEVSDEETGEETDTVLFVKTPQGQFRQVSHKQPFRKFQKFGGGGGGGFKKPGDSKPGFKRPPLALKPTDICVLCNAVHEMSRCPKFKELSMPEKKLIMRSSVLCYHCLSTKHFIRDCKYQEGKFCGVRDCKRYHHPMLHEDAPQITFEYDHNQFDPLTEEEEQMVAHFIEADDNTPRMAHVAGNGAISLQTIVCNVSTSKGNIRTVALLDTGSTMTAIDEDFAFAHGFKILQQREGQAVYTVDRLVKFKGTQYLVEVIVSSVENGTVTKVDAWTVKNLVGNCGIVDWRVKKKEFPHLKRVRFPPLPEDPRVTILFGINTTRMFRSTQTVCNPDDPSHPIAIRTMLGWTCIGRSDNPEQLTTDPTPHLNSILFKDHPQQ